MFTGLVQVVGTVTGVEPSAAGARLRVDPGRWSYLAAVGDSISVSGCCLTLASPPTGTTLSFDVVHETLRLTTLGTLEPGSRVNLEHAARADTLLGGHVVQGHVDGLAEVVSVTRSPEYRLTLRPPDALMEFMIPKGSVCIDGVSLTLARVDPGAGTFDVALIPTTLEKTTLAELAPGSRVNLETDILARTVVHWLRTYGR